MSDYFDDPVYGVGIDIGSSLAKIAVAGQDGEFAFALMDNYSCKNLVNFVRDLEVRFCGVTGSGALDFKQKIKNLGNKKGVDIPEIFCSNEFVSWGAGAAKLLKSTSQKIEMPYLLGSIGTGTSIMLVNGLSITRVGGTALGGGTVMGLGRLLLGGGTFQEICSLADKGKSSKVDLLLKDIYKPGQVGISPKATASNFGKLADPRRLKDNANLRDIMAGLMELVAENIALIASGLMNLYRVDTIVYAGSTLRNNRSLRSALINAGELLDHKVVILDQGEFSGAVGAYQLSLSNFT